MDSKIMAIMGSGPLALWAGAALADNSTSMRIRFGNTRGVAPAWLPASLAKAVSEGRVEWRVLDAMDAENLKTFAAGSSALLHCANPRYDQWAAVLPVMQRNAIVAAVAAGSRLICADNLYAYAPPVKAPLTEASPENPPSRKGAIRKDMHALLSQAQAGQGLRWATVQSSDYFGPGAGEQSYFGNRFADPLLRGKAAAFIGDPSLRHAWAYAPDFGRALAWLAVTDKADSLNRSWILPHVTDLPALEMAKEFMEEMATQKILPSQTPQKIGSIPRFLLRVLGLFNPVIREIDEMLYQFYMDFRADGSAFAKHSGIQATKPEQAIQETVSYWKATKTPA